MTHNQRVKLWSAATLIVTFVVTAALLRWEGRMWFCKCGEPRLWIAEADGPHTSQHLLDPYSLSHFQHGLLLFVVLVWALPDRPRRAGVPSGDSPSNPGDGPALRRRVLRFWIATLAECAWEVFENSAFVINRYREGTAALGYTGDSVWNSLGDVVACVAGYLIAMSLGWRRTLVLFAAIELGMVVWIRDSLLLNVLMLVYPIEAIKAWQTAA
jgi:hypothetical protein